MQKHGLKNIVENSCVHNWCWVLPDLELPEDVRGAPLELFHLLPGLLTLTVLPHAIGRG